MPDNRSFAAEPATRSSGAGLVVAVVLLFVLVIGFAFFSQISAVEPARDGSVKSAAGNDGQRADDDAAGARHGR